MPDSAFGYQTPPLKLLERQTWLPPGTRWPFGLVVMNRPVKGTAGPVPSDVRGDWTGREGSEQRWYPVAVALPLQAAREWPWHADADLSFPLPVSWRTHPTRSHAANSGHPDGSARKQQRSQYRPKVTKSDVGNHCIQPVYFTE